MVGDVLGFLLGGMKSLGFIHWILIDSEMYRAYHIMYTPSTLHQQLKNLTSFHVYLPPQHLHPSPSSGTSTITKQPSPFSPLLHYLYPPINPPQPPYTTLNPTPSHTPTTPPTSSPNPQTPSHTSFAALEPSYPRPPTASPFLLSAPPSLASAHPRDCAGGCNRGDGDGLAGLGYFLLSVKVRSLVGFIKMCQLRMSG